MKKDVLRNLTKFTGKRLCQSLFFIQKTWNFIKKETLAQVLSCEFCQISLRTPFLQNTSGLFLRTGLSLETSKSIHNYLSKRVQRVKISSCFSDQLNIWTSLFDIVLSDLFFDDIEINLANYADVTNPCANDFDKISSQITCKKYW